VLLKAKGYCCARSIDGKPNRIDAELMELLLLLLLLLLGKREKLIESVDNLCYERGYYYNNVAGSIEFFNKLQKAILDVISYPLLRVLLSLGSF